MATIDEYTCAFMQAKLARDDPDDERDARYTLAQQLSVTVKFIELVLQKKRNFSTDVAERLAKHFGYTHLEMLEEGRRIVDGASAEPKVRQPWSDIRPIVQLVGEFNEQLDPEKIPLENYYAAPLVKGYIAAGPGAEISENEIQSLVWIYAPELRDRRHHRLVAVQVDPKNGTSMTPTLYPGDIVLIDRNDPQSDVDFKSGRLYAIRTGPIEAGCAIKRVHKRSEGIIIASDNFEHTEPVLSWTDDIMALVIGRVVWGCRNLLKV